MNTKQQIAIDKYIAKPIAFFSNFIVRALGQVLSIDHNLNKEFKVVAISKFKGMGSILQATPMIAAIKRKNPNTEIIFISTKPNYTILSKIDSIDTIITVDDSNLYQFVRSNIIALAKLIRKRPEVYFDLEIYSDYSTLFALFSLSVNRIGFYLRSSSFRMGIYTHMMFFNPRVPISKVYLQLTKLIGCDTEDLEIYPLMVGTKQRPKRARKHIVINPNSSDLRLERRWPQKSFIGLVQALLEGFPEFDILLIGGKGEETDYTEEIAVEINNDRVISLAGKTSLEDLTSIINDATLMVTNDTGPMHIAFCVKTPVVCLFGPCSPDQYGLGKFAHIIYKKTYCSPCIHDFEVAPCNGDNVCMKLIEVNEVYSKVSELLSTENPENMQQESNFIYTELNNVF